MNDTFLDRIKLYFDEDYLLYLEELKKPCTQGFFLNSKKGSKDDILKIVDFEYFSSDLTDDSFYHTHENIGKTKAYELGLLYPQEIAASLTTKYIDTNNIHRVVDLCAAPGGKTINIANRINNDCLIISNDNSHLRASILSSNLERLGIDNVIVTNKEVDELSKQLYNYADLVILDAPCSGEGMVRKYPEIIDHYDLNNIYELSKLQSDLLENAYDILSNDGYLVYSTCTYAFEEDEKQIENFLNMHQDVELIKMDNPFYSKMEGCIKLCPINNTEGQFFALLHKTGIKNNKDYKKLEPCKEKTIDLFIKENLNLDHYYLYKNNDHYYLSFIELPNLKYNVLKYCIYCGDLVKGRFEPSHHLYRANSLIGKFKYVYDLNEKEYDLFISGNQINTIIDNHYYLLTYKGYSLGFGKASNNTIKNKYPKGLRRVL